MYRAMIRNRLSFAAKIANALTDTRGTFFTGRFWPKDNRKLTLDNSLLSTAAQLLEAAVNPSLFSEQCNGSSTRPKQIEEKETLSYRQRSVVCQQGKRRISLSPVLLVHSLTTNR
jgi:hypothetical protein